MVVLLLFVLNINILGVSFGKLKLPVVLMHGIDGSEDDFHVFVKFIEKHSPDTVYYPLHCYCDEKSWVDMRKQAQCVIEEITQLKKDKGLQEYHLIGHSQGALVTRAVLQLYENHGVQNYISMSGPQLGQYGIPSDPVFEPWKNLTMALVTDLLYEPFIMEILSFANYWKDPLDMTLYFYRNTYLPWINNIVNYNPKFRENFIKTKYAVFYGTELDSVIIPWQSAMFGFYECGDPGSVDKIIPYHEQKVFTNDSFGLRTMQEEGRLKIEYAKDKGHADWLLDEDMFVKFILPYLT